MEEMVQTFLETIHERRHVLELLPKKERLMIELKSGEASATVTLANGEFSILGDGGPCALYGKITGELPEIKLLLEGRAELRKLAAQGRLKVSAPFRTILLLESLFYLTKAEKKWDQAI